MEEEVDFRKCFICHDKTQYERIQRECVQCFCKLFNLPNSTYEDELLKEAFFCVQCLENIGKIKQLYQKLEKVKEDIENFRDLFENQITQKCPLIQELLNPRTETIESKLNTVSSSNILDTSEKLRTEIINKIQHAALEGSEKKTSSASGNSENQVTQTNYSEETQVKIEAENDWSSPESPFISDNNEYSDNDGNRSDDDGNRSDVDISYSKRNSIIAHPSTFRRSTRSQTALLPCKKTRGRDTSNYSGNSTKRRKLDVKVEEESSCSENDEDKNPAVLSAKTISKSRPKRNQTKKKLLKTRERKKKNDTSTASKRRKVRCREKVESTVNWIRCSRENCNFKFRDENKLTVHIKRYHDGIQRPHACLEPGCGRTFRITSDLEKHQAVHSGVKSFVCEFCGKSFFTEQLLNVHRNIIHLKNFPLHCEICSKGIRSKPEMDLHMLKHNTQDNTPFECYCGKRFSTSHILKTHQQAHNDEFKCIPCNKSFANKCSLEEHNFKHNGLYPFKCTKCNFGTRKKERFRMHMDGHEGIKVECKVCGKKVSERCLPKHMKTHDSERPKPFVCEQCGKAFTDRHKLKCHAIIHTGERPFQCNICGKAAYSRGNLTKHMKCHEKPGTSVRNERTSQNNIEDLSHPLFLPFS